MLILCLLCACGGKRSQTDWPIYRGDEGTNAYSSLNQINKENVSLLKPAWIYRAGKYSDNTTLECNPLIIDKVLYGISPTVKTFALDARTGKELWVFNPYGEDHKLGGFYRGLTYWKGDGEERIFMCAGNRLMALNARTGKLIDTFGTDGYVDLNRGLRFIDGVEQKEDVKNTSPGIIYKDLIIVGSVIAEDYDSSPGHIRAYDVRTGEQKWIFHTVPEQGEFGYDTWQDGNASSGGCNAWSGLSLDSKRGIVFAATGSPTFDFHGGERIGADLFGNSLLALDAATGKLIWHYQLVHHDLWDYDLPAPPNLVTVLRDGRQGDAVAQLTKQGFVFLFERETGKPLFDIREVPVPASRMPGEQSFATQPVPVKPLPLARQKFDEDEITNISKESHDYVLGLTRKLGWGNIFLPPSPEGIIQMPGMRGGAEWSGGCVDPQTAIMYVGINDIANVVELEEQKVYDRNAYADLPLAKAGELIYQINCASCHGADRKGNSAFPSLETVAGRLSPDDVKNVLKNPGGRMPSFAVLPEQDRQAIVAYLFNMKDQGVYVAPNESDSTVAPDLQKRKRRYVIKGYNFLKDQYGYPGVKPPWGTLNAVDLNSGEIVWKMPLGEYAELKSKGVPATGTQLFGGGIVTAGGLIFIGASADEKFRAIDKTTGEILWEYQLPCGGYATPSTYEIDGKQYVVIAAGGGGSQATRGGDYYIAFRLPE